MARRHGVRNATQITPKQITAEMATPIQGEYSPNISTPRILRNYLRSLLTQLFTLKRQIVAVKNKAAPAGRTAAASRLRNGRIVWTEAATTRLIGRGSGTREFVDRCASKKAPNQNIAANTAASCASSFVRKVAAAMANATPMPKHGTAKIARRSFCISVSDPILPTYQRAPEPGVLNSKPL